MMVGGFCDKDHILSIEISVNFWKKIPSFPQSKFSSGGNNKNL